MHMGAAPRGTARPSRVTVQQTDSLTQTLTHAQPPQPRAHRKKSRARRARRLQCRPLCAGGSLAALRLLARPSAPQSSASRDGLRTDEAGAEVRTRGRGWRSSKAVRSSRRARHAPCASRRRRRAPWLARRRPSRRSAARLPLRAARRGTFRREVKVHLGRRELGGANALRSTTPTLAKIGACVAPLSTPSCSPGVHSLSSLERLLLRVRGEGGHDLTHLRIRNRPE